MSELGAPKQNIVAHKGYHVNPHSLDILMEGKWVYSAHPQNMMCTLVMYTYNLMILVLDNTAN